MAVSIDWGTFLLGWYKAGVEVLLGWYDCNVMQYGH